jgi:hypothetical protein
MLTKDEALRIAANVAKLPFYVYNKLTSAHHIGAIINKPREGT